MQRQGFIGGSDCVKIMQGEWLQLWKVKTGRAQSDDLSDNIAVQLGSYTEDFNLKWFEKQYNCVLTHHQNELSEIIGSVPAKGTIDAAFNMQPVEAKHTNAFNTMNDIIDRYMPQIQMYAKLAGWKRMKDGKPYMSFKISEKQEGMSNTNNAPSALPNDSIPF